MRRDFRETGTPSTNSLTGGRKLKFPFMRRPFVRRALPGALPRHLPWHAGPWPRGNGCLAFSSLARCDYSVSGSALRHSPARSRVVFTDPGKHTNNNNNNGNNQLDAHKADPTPARLSQRHSSPAPRLRKCVREPRLYGSLAPAACRAVHAHAAARTQRRVKTAARGGRSVSRRRLAKRLAARKIVKRVLEYLRGRVWEWRQTCLFERRRTGTRQTSPAGGRVTQACDLHRRCNIQEDRELSHRHGWACRGRGSAAPYFRITPKSSLRLLSAAPSCRRKGGRNA